MKDSSEKSATPYLVGAGIGVLNGISFLTAQRGLGVSTAYENLAAKIERRFAPDLTKINAYIKEREEAPKTDWESFLALGLPLGSFLAARASRDRLGKVEAPVRAEAFGTSGPKRHLAAFLGGAVMMIGARMAKGCTSGHGITGTSQLALSSLIFTPLIFATGAIAARALNRKVT